MSGANRFVIIGNGVAGTTAAEQIKKEEPNAVVDLITDEPYPLYNRVALPPFLRGDVAESKVLMRSVDDHANKGINLHLETRVTEVRTEEKAVVTSDGRVFPYDKLLVATGGRANPLRASGAEGIRHIYTFQTLDDTKEIIARVESAQSAVVIGGSFIAYELAEAFRTRGLETAWVMRGPYFLRRILDEEGGSLVDSIARRHGVRMMYGEEIAEVKSSGGEVTGVVTRSGETIDAELVGVGIGLTLNTGLLEGTGVEIGSGIRTDEFLRTNLADVYAAGDIAEFYDAVVGEHHTMGTWNNAASHGKVAGRNMLGASEPYETVPTYTSGLFDSKLAVMGATPEISREIESHSFLDMEKGNYARYFLLRGKLVGAVLIGDMSPRRAILKMIRDGEPVRDPKELPRQA